MNPNTIKRTIRITAVATVVAVTSAAIQTALPGDLAHSASAQEENEDLDKAKERFRTGKAAFEDGDYDTAAEAFLDAYQFSGRNELLYNVAQSYRRAGELRNAETYFQKYLEKMPDAPNADQVVEEIIEIQDEMAEKMAKVDVDSTPPGLNVFADDEESARCQSPCTVSLLPGDHRLTARDPDGGEASTTITVQAKQNTSVTIQVEAPVQTGKLELSTDARSGTMSIQGHGTQSLPMTAPIELPAGTHQISVSSDGKRWTGSIDVPANQTRRILVPLSGVEQSGGSPLRTASFGLAGASVGLLVGGLLMGNSASKTFDALEQQQGDLGSVDSGMVDRGRQQQMGANILYGAGLTTLGAGVGLFVFDMMSKKSGEQDIPPSESPSPDSSEQADVTQLGAK